MKRMKRKRMVGERMEDRERERMEGERIEGERMEDGGRGDGGREDGRREERGRARGRLLCQLHDPGHQLSPEGHRHIGEDVSESEVPCGPPSVHEG